MADLGSTGLGASVEEPTSIEALRLDVSSSPDLILMPDELNSILEVHRPEVLSDGAADGGFRLGGSSVQVCDDELLTSASPVEVEGLASEQGVVVDDVL
ncbi:hypothetical protein Dimus_033534 [Dionaea muscipula]